MILMFGDIHGSFKHVNQLVKTHKPAAIILLGDIEADQSLEKKLDQVMSLTEVYWIYGNHDVDESRFYDNLFSSKLDDRNLHGRVVEIDGHKVAGLGGVFDQLSWYPKHDVDAEPLHDNYEGLMSALHEKLIARSAYASTNKEQARESYENNQLKHKCTIFYEEWADLCAKRADILVTHDAPSCHPYGFLAIDELARSLRVKSSFHGHMHDRLDYSDQHQALGFKAHGVGFRGVSDQDGNLIAKGEYDDENERRYLSSKRNKDK